MIGLQVTSASGEMSTQQRTVIVDAADAPARPQPAAAHQPVPGRDARRASRARQDQGEPLHGARTAVRDGLGHVPWARLSDRQRHHARRSRRAPASRGAAALPRRQPAHRRRLEGRARRKGHGVPVPHAQATAANGPLPAARSRDRGTVSKRLTVALVGCAAPAGGAWSRLAARRRRRRREPARGRRRPRPSPARRRRSVANRSETPGACAAPDGTAAKHATPPRGRGTPAACGTPSPAPAPPATPVSTGTASAPAAGRARPCARPGPGARPRHRRRSRQPPPVDFLSSG